MQTGIPFNKPLIAGKELYYIAQAVVFGKHRRERYISWVSDRSKVTCFYRRNAVQEGPGGLVNENFAYSTKHSIEEA